MIADDIAIFNRRLAARDQRGLGGGAAHVEADALLEAQMRRKATGADHAGNGSGFHHGHRLQARLIERHNAAVGAHDMHLPAEVLAAQIGFQRVQIIAHARAHESVERGGRGALVFAELAQDLVAEGDEERGVHAAQDVADDLLVLGVGVGVQEAHRHRFHARLFEFKREALDFGGVDGGHHIAAGGHALVHLEGVATLDQRLGAMEPEVEGLDAIAAPDGVDIAEALGGDERGERALALQHRVDGDGGAMQHFAQAGQMAGRERQGGGDAEGRIGWCRRGLGCDDASIHAADEIREGPADIYAYDVHSFTEFLSVGGRRLPGVSLFWARRTSSLKSTAMIARHPVSAKRGAGS